jgi:hypothetical protein
LQTNRIVRL